MVFGPIQDAMKARAEHRSLVSVMAEGNKLVQAKLPLGFKFAFWLTYVPYFLLSARLASAPPQVAGAAWVHATAMRSEPMLFPGRDEVNPRAGRDCARELYAAAGIGPVFSSMTFDSGSP